MREVLCPGNKRIVVRALEARNIKADRSRRVKQPGFGKSDSVRLPTLAELDQAAPNHPVYLQTGFTGPAVVNTHGQGFLAQRGVAVGADGRLAENAPTVAAWKALLALQTDADRRRGAADAMAYAARVGLTMSVDRGGAWPADTPGAEGLAQLGAGAHYLWAPKAKVKSRP